MKKGWLLMLTAVLLLLCCAFSCAEEVPLKEADLFDLWDFGDESPSWVGFAVPVTEGILVTSPACLPDNTEDLVISDGKSLWEVKAVLPDGDNLLAFILFDPADKPARYGEYVFLPYGESADVSSCYIRYGDAMNSRINRAVLSAEQLYWKGHNCYLLSLSDPVPLGSPLVTSDGMLAAIVTAEWAEGLNRVLALPMEEVAGSLIGVAGLVKNLPPWQDAPEGLVVTLDKNLATIDWKEMVLPEKTAGEKIYLVIADTGNRYLNYYPAETKECSLTTLLTPGRLYLAGIVVSDHVPDMLPNQFTVISVPQVKKLTEYHFRPVLTAIAEAPESGLKNGELPVPVTEVTRDLLQSGRAYFYSHTTYEVTKEIGNCTLLVTITDPDGMNYRWESSWIYSPDYMEKDIWSVSLKESGLITALEENGYEAGWYRMAFYVDGSLADSFDFYLK